MNHDDITFMLVWLPIVHWGALFLCWSVFIHFPPIDNSFHQEYFIVIKMESRRCDEVEEGAVVTTAVFDGGLWFDDIDWDAFVNAACVDV